MQKFLEIHFGNKLPCRVGCRFTHGVVDSQFILSLYPRQNEWREVHGVFGEASLTSNSIVVGTTELIVWEVPGRAIEILRRVIGNTQLA